MKRKHRNSGRWWTLKITRFCSCPLVIILSDYSDLTRRWGEKIYCSFYLWIWFSKSPRNLHLRSCKPVVIVSMAMQCQWMASLFLSLERSRATKTKTYSCAATVRGGWVAAKLHVSFVGRCCMCTSVCQWCYRLQIQCDEGMIDRGLTEKMSLVSNES